MTTVMNFAEPNADRGENFGVILALSDDAEYEKRRLFVVARAERRI